MGAQGIPTQGFLKTKKIENIFGGSSICDCSEAHRTHFEGELIACRSFCIKKLLQESEACEASSACLCVLAAWRTIYAWTSASASSGASRGRALHRAQCTARRALHQCIPKVHPTCWRAAAKSRPTAFDLTCSLFQTVLSLPARLESVLDEM